MLSKSDFDKAVEALRKANISEPLIMYNSNGKLIIENEKKYRDIFLV